MRTSAQKLKAAQQTSSAKSPKPNRSFVGHNHDVQSVLHLQRTSGNQAVLRLLHTAKQNLDSRFESNASTGFAHDFSRIPVFPGASNTIQSKLKVNAPKDLYEQEADRIAGEVLRQQVSEEEDKKVEIQARASRQAAGDERDVNEENENRLSRSKGGGSPLSDEVRAFFEPRMQSDFSNVQVHTDNEAARMNQELGARAFTHGRNIYFGVGQYNPHTIEGKQLLAHELTHVVQQNDGRVFPSLIQRNPGPVLLTHTVSLINQESSNTCWAASVAMLATYFSGTQVAPIDVALRGDQQRQIYDTFYSDLYALDRGLPVSYENYRDLVAPWGLVVLGSVGLGTVNEWVDILDNYGPVVLDRYMLQPRHAVVVTGIEGDGTPQGTDLYINDPSGRQTTLPVQRLSGQLMHIIRRA